MSARPDALTPAPTDAALLREYVQRGTEAAFTAVVERHAGLVLATALRITGDRSLAEEAAQNVFALLARKASSVVKIPEPAAWLYQSTVFHAKRRLRAELRHRRKLAAFSAAMIPPESEESDTHAGALLPFVDACIQRLRPQEQRAVRMRYLEGRSYDDIATALGKSVEAGKKQTARAMERLCLLLRRRGIISAAALGTLLHAGARTASAFSTTPLASAALSAAPALTRSALLLHALHAMNTTRTVAAAAIVLALCTAPVLRQEFAIARARSELSAASVDAAAPPLSPDPAAPVVASVSSPAGVRPAAPDGDKPLTIGIVADLLTTSLPIFAFSESGRQLKRLQAADSAELVRLVEASKALSGAVERRERVQMRLLDMLREKDPAAGAAAGAGLVAQISKDGYMNLQISLSQIYEEWLKKNPEAALRSFQDFHAKGTFNGPGIDQDPYILTGAVVGGSYASNRDEALRLYENLSRKDRMNALIHFAQDARPEDRAFILGETAEVFRGPQAAVYGAMLTGEAQRNGPAAAAELLKQLEIPPGVRVKAVKQAMDHVSSAPREARAAEALQWAKQNLTAEEFAEAGGQWLASPGNWSVGDSDTTRMDALRAFDWGPARDTAIAAFFKTDRRFGSREAAALAGEIQNHDLKVATLRRIAELAGVSVTLTEIINSNPDLTEKDRLHILSR